MRRQLLPRTVAAVAAMFAFTILVPAGSAVAAPSVRPASTSAAASTTASTAAVPAGFRAQSVAWTSPERGWLLGAAPCAAGQCTVVLGTRDGGRHWAQLSRPDVPLAASGMPGVTTIRFADPVHGWLFGPALLRTDDGGRTWQRTAIPGRGQEVLALAATAGFAYLAVSPCVVGEPCDQAPTVWRAPVAVSAWRPVPVTLPAGAARQVVLAARDGVVYVLGTQPPPAPDAFFASVGGVRWAARTSPCSKVDDASLVDVVPTGGPNVALLCVGDPGFSRAIKQAFRSTDTARTIGADAGTTPLDGIQSELAATPDALLVASTSIASLLYLNTGGQTWTTVATQDGVGWKDAILVNARHGYVVFGPAAATPSNPGQLIATTDGGQHWAPVPLG